MLKHISLVLLLLSTLTSCARFHSTDVSSTSTASDQSFMARLKAHVFVQRPRSAPSLAAPVHAVQGPLRAYTRVEVEGPLDITLHTGRSAAVQLQGDPRDSAAIAWGVRDGVLKIKPEKGYPKYGPVHLDLSMRVLRSFVYHGTGTIRGQQLDSQALNLLIDNRGYTDLEGHLQLTCLVLRGRGETLLRGITGRLPILRLAGAARAKLSGVLDIGSIEMRDQSWLSIHWIESRALRVKMQDHAFMQLAGVVDWMDAQIHDNARFHGRYLRVTNAFVKTFQHAVAEISAVRRQHTFATDASQIYFYNLPQMKADFMDVNGAVLDLREWSMPYLQEPTRYNHT